MNWAEHPASATTLRKNVKLKKAANEEKKVHFEFPDVFNVDLCLSISVH